jgi:rfaE bifunctional protein nucleotidyltransferase chain/domain
MKTRSLDLIHKKIVSLDIACENVRQWKEQSKKIVFTNGCFDILHRGHITYLAEAADFGEKLIIGLNSDASVKRQGKGADRPINDQDSRGILLAALSFVDLIVIFDTETPLPLIAELLPDILVKGADYDAEELDTTSRKFIVGSDLVRSYGGSVKTVPVVKGFSTTSMLERIKK